MSGGLSRRFGLIGAAAAILLTALLPVTAAASSHSGEGVNLTTSPLPINIVARPGETKTVDLKVKNSGTKSMQLRVDLMKFKAFGDEGKPRLLDREPGDDYFDWVSFSQKTFTAEPGVFKTIKMTIRVPKSASYGYYYAAVFSPATKPAPTADRTAAVVGATATLVLLEARVPGAKRALEAVEFTTDRKVYEFLPTSFTVKIKNKGTVHAAPYGSIFLRRGSGRDVAVVPINQEKGNILPSSNRIYTASWQEGFPLYVDKKDGDRVVRDRDGRPQQELKWDFSNQINKIRFGKYTANLLMVYDDGQRDVPVEAVVSFWVVPWRLLAGLLAVLALVGFLGVRYVQMRRTLKALKGKG